MRTARTGLITWLAALTCSCGGPAETEVPFRFDDRVVIEAAVNGVGGVTLVLDTGAPERDLSILWPGLVDELGLVVRERFMSRGGFELGVAEGAVVRIGDFEFRSESVVVALERRENFPEQDGIVGRLVFDSCVVELDYDRSKLTLRRGGVFEAPPGWSEVALTIQDGVPVLEVGAEFEDGRTVPLRLFADLGSREPLMLWENAGRGVFPPEDAPEEFIGSSAYGDVHGRRGRLRALHLDGLEVRDLGAAFVDPGSGAELGPPGLDGVVGAPVLSRFNLMFDYPRRRLLLTPRSTGEGGSQGGREA
jgi:hypothetical protein